MGQKLCDNCFAWAKDYQNKYGGIELDPWTHCHHDEPEKPGYVWKPFRKKPKEECRKDECWCDNPADDVEDSKGESWVTDWCPTCGRKLEESE